MLLLCGLHVELLLLVRHGREESRIFGGQVAQPSWPNDRSVWIGCKLDIIRDAVDGHTSVGVGNEGSMVTTAGKAVLVIRERSSEGSACDFGGGGY